MINRPGKTDRNTEPLPRAGHRAFSAGMISGRRMALILTCLLLAASFGCGKESREVPKPPRFEIEKEYPRGPVVFTIKVSKSEITIADSLQLVIDVQAQEDYEVKLPEFGEKLEQFGIVDYHAPPPRLTDSGKVELRKIYELEPFLSGDYTIPAMKVLFWEKGKEEEKNHEVESEPLTITVKSLLPEKAADLTIKEIRPPLDLPAPPWGLIFGVGGAGVLGGGCLLGYFYWRRRQRANKAESYRPAHEIAYDELAALLAEDLVEKGGIKEFHLRLSRILRHYIENRFGLRAPERTTEEFLEDLRTTDTLIPNHKNLLKEFLRHCDMVKFAEHQPTTEEIQNTFDACKRFIVETESQEISNPPDRGDAESMKG